jgi:hypothetical protein
MNLWRLIILALMAQLLAAPATSGMLVLCIGNDGHVAVESASASLCCREWGATFREDPGDLLATFEAASSPCCNDVELSVESARLTVPSQKVIPISALPRRVPALASPLRQTSVGSFPLSTESPVAASLRTVVLRT